MYHHIFLTMTDGHAVDGIIENEDNESISVLVGEDVMMREDGELDDRTVCRKAPSPLRLTIMFACTDDRTIDGYN